MVSSRNNAGQFISLTQAQMSIAGAFNDARLAVLDGYLDGDISRADDEEAIGLFINTFNSSINTFYSGVKYGNAQERTPAPWIGAAKSVYINLFP